MSLILSIETSTRNCSVALSKSGKTLAIKEASSDQYIHSEKLHVFIEELIHSQSIDFTDIDAVAVTKGPGSYTGLRIGVSAAKGLCFSINKPLIAIDSLTVLAQRSKDTVDLNKEDLLIPMIDARRMEVYCAIFNSEASIQSDVEAKIIDENSFSELMANKIYLLGDGASKVKEVLDNERLQWLDIDFPNADALGKLAYSKYLNQEFEDLAYFEPWYFKDFVAGKPKKLL